MILKRRVSAMVGIKKGDLVLNELALLLLVVVALAIGWGLGRRERKQSKS